MQQAQGYENLDRATKDILHAIETQADVFSRICKPSLTVSIVAMINVDFSGSRIARNIVKTISITPKHLVNLSNEALVKAEAIIVDSPPWTYAKMLISNYTLKHSNGSFKTNTLGLVTASRTGCATMMAFIESVIRRHQVDRL